MAALVMTVPTGPASAAVTRNAASASDTISAAQLGDSGVYLRIETTGTASDVTVSDAGRTAGGNPASTTAVAMGATERRAVYISPKQADPATGLVTITSTAQTGLFYEVYPA